MDQFYVFKWWFCLFIQEVGFFFYSYLLLSSFSVYRLPSNAIRRLQTACLWWWLVSYFLIMKGKGGSLRIKIKQDKTHLSNPIPSSAGAQTDSLHTWSQKSFSLCSAAGEELGPPWYQRGFLSCAPVSVVLGKTRYMPGADYEEKLHSKNNSTAFMDMSVLPQQAKMFGALILGPFAFSKNCNTL